MRAHPVLVPNYTHTASVGVYREFCAALLWLDAGSFSLAMLKQPPQEARITLCTMLGLTATPTTPTNQSDRILKYVTAKRALQGPQVLRAEAVSTGPQVLRAETEPAARVLRRSGPYKRRNHQWRRGRRRGWWRRNSK